MKSSALLLPMVRQLYEDCRYIAESSPTQPVDEDSCLMYNRLLQQIQKSYPFCHQLRRFREIPSRNLKFKDIVILTGQMQALLERLVKLPETVTRKMSQAPAPKTPATPSRPLNPIPKPLSNTTPDSLSPIPQSHERSSPKAPMTPISAPLSPLPKAIPTPQFQTPPESPSSPPTSPPTPQDPPVTRGFLTEDEMKVSFDELD